MITLYKVYLKVNELNTDEIRFTALYDIVNMTDGDYVLYAITDKKSLIKEFKDTRDTKKVFILKDIMDKETYSEYVKNCDIILGYYDFQTADEDNTLTTISILTTKKEFEYIKRDAYLIQEMIYNTLVNPKTPYNIFSDDYTESLVNILYGKLYDYSSYIGDKPDIKMDMYKLLVYRNSILFNFER